MKFLGHTEPYPVTMLEPAAPEPTEVERLQQEVADLRAQLDSVTKERDERRRKAWRKASLARIASYLQELESWIACDAPVDATHHEAVSGLQPGRLWLSEDQCRALSDIGWQTNLEFPGQVDPPIAPATIEMYRAAQDAGVRLQFWSERIGDWHSWVGTGRSEWFMDHDPTPFRDPTPYRIDPIYANGPTRDLWESP